MEIVIDGTDGGQRPNALPDERLRLLDSACEENWAERYVCELVLVVECCARGFAVTDLVGTRCVWEIAPLPLCNGLTPSAQGRVLSARMEALSASSEPPRLRDSLLAQRLRPFAPTPAAVRRKAS